MEVKIADEAPKRGRPKKEDAAPMLPVWLKFDYWDLNRVRHKGGKDAEGFEIVVDLPVKEALALIAEGKAERRDPIPGA